MTEQQSVRVITFDRESDNSDAGDLGSVGALYASSIAPTFQSVLAAVTAAAGLTSKVRSNLCSAVHRTAALMGGKGLTATIDIPAIAKRLETMTAAKLGMKTKEALAAYKSNLRRALKVAGVTIMPGRSRDKLSANWQSLADRLQTECPFAWPALSRFVHYASEQGWEHNAIDCMAFKRFALDLRTTCLTSKAEKTLRNTARAWVAAQSSVPDWPKAKLGYQPKRRAAKTRPWTDFPAALLAEALEFVQAGSNNWLSDDDRFPIKEATQSNYLWAVRRAASIIVSSGTPIDQLDCLAKLVTPANAKIVVTKVYEDTGRKVGGMTQMIAWIMYRIADVHLRCTEPELKPFRGLVQKTRPQERRMGDRTLDRVRPFTDSDLLAQFFRMPDKLMVEASKRPVDIRSAKLVRLALYLAILQDTAARSKNVFSLNMKTQIMVDGQGKAQHLFVCIAGVNVKNGTEIRAALSKSTGKIYRAYVDTYRCVHDVPGGGASDWLFPRTNESHWTSTQACADLKDAAARLLGVDVTPHLTRSLVGKVILNARPDAYPDVQHMLGHKSLATTITHYTHLDPEKSRRIYHEILADMKVRRVR